MAKKKSVIIMYVLMVLNSCTYDRFSLVSSKCATTTISLALSVVNTSACGAKDGSLAIAASGGTQAYSFSVNGGNYQDNTAYTNLAAGSYTVLVKDANGCTATQIVAVNNGQSTLKVSEVSTANSGCATPNGTIRITATGGKKPIEYKLNSGSYQASNTFTGLTAGNYSISVLDSSGCPTSGSATVAFTGSSYKTDVSPIIATYCSSCHSGNRNPNLSSYSNISASGSSIVGAINSNMPPGGKLTTQQVALITCWVNNGSLNN